MKTKDGGPAFPCPDDYKTDGTPVYGPNNLQGMSLKAYIATAALAGWASGRNIRMETDFTGPSHHKKVADACVLYADALIAELNKE